MLSLRAAFTSKALYMQIWSINFSYKWHCTKITVTSPSVARKNVEKITSFRNNYNSRRNGHKLLYHDGRNLHPKLVHSTAN